jgi:DNA-directed RNA polymerase II subunit RPB2
MYPHKKRKHKQQSGFLVSIMDRGVFRNTVGPALVRCFVTDDARKNLVRHQLDSFADFVFHRIPATIAQCNDVHADADYLPELKRFRHRLTVRIENPQLTRPTSVDKDGIVRPLTPHEARLRGISYSGNLYVDIHVSSQTIAEDDCEANRRPNTDQKVLRNVLVGKIPIMVGSKYCIYRSVPLLSAGECRYDPGGYFIINGNEKVIISNDRMAENKTFVFANNKAVVSCSHTAEIRSVGWTNGGMGSVKSLVLRMSTRQNQFGNYVRVALPHAKQEVPVVLLFRALGVETDRDVVHMVCGTQPCADILANALVGSIAESADVRCARDAMDALSRIMGCHTQAGDDSAAGQEERGAASEPASQARQLRCLDHVRYLIARDILPHTGKSFRSKALYLAHMVRRLLRVAVGLDEPDDRDSYINKRVDTPGVMLASLFRAHYVRMIKEMRNSISRDIANGAWKSSGGVIGVINRVTLSKHIKPGIIDSGLKYALATGNWNVKGVTTYCVNSSRKQGVAQVLNRLTYLATLSHLRRINTPMEKNGKMVQPRKLHSTQWGVICPCETPEGASVGLVKNLALLAGITTHCDPGNVIWHVHRLGLVQDDGTQRAVVMVNGRIIGFHDDPVQLVRALKEMKLAAALHVHTSIVLDVIQRVVDINTEGGRLVRPLLVCDANRPRITPDDAEQLSKGTKRWWQIVTEGKIEYMDVNECNHSMIAMTYEALSEGDKFTHLEIDPTCIMGVIASCVPFSDHNQAPRNTYQSSMGKQAIGINVSNFDARFDTVNHVLHYPQKAIVQTRAARMLACDRLPNGVNAMVAIMTYSGYNQEDSVLLNRAALQRGMFVSTMYKTFREQNMKNHANGEEEFFSRPHPTHSRGLKPCDYNKLAEDGFVPENTRVQDGDIIIGKCMPQKVGAELLFRDSSVPFKGSDAAVIDRNCYNDNYFPTTNGDGYTFAKTRVRCVLDPVVGDKFSSRHAQKGTCGMILDDIDLPFNAEGVIPEIVMNTHAIPSRMTIAQLLEGVAAKAACFEGLHADASAFQQGDFDTVADALRRHGRHGYGDELLYEPVSGSQLPVDVFFTPTYYQRLKHLSGQKVHSRGANGPVVLLTRQPTEGRSREGALRLGSMETHVLVAHGVQQFLKERFMECSDNFFVFVCNKCGFMSEANREQGMFACRGCKHASVDFSELRIPASCKLLIQEIHALGVGTRFITA